MIMLRPKNYLFLDFLLIFFVFAFLSSFTFLSYTNSICECTNLNSGSLFYVVSITEKDLRVLGLLRRLFALRGHICAHKDVTVYSSFTIV